MMTISIDEFQSIDGDGLSLPALGPDTTQRAAYCFLFEHADQAFREREIVDASDSATEWDSDFKLNVMEIGTLSKLYFEI